MLVVGEEEVFFLSEVMNGGGGEEAEVGILEKRAHIKDLYAQVQLGHPSLPPLRDFQVASIPALHIPHKSQSWFSALY